MKPSSPNPAQTPGDEERTLLRSALRAWLQQHWPAETALTRASDRAAVAALWRGLHGQGLAVLGSDPTEGGLREAVLVMEEVGRASAPAPIAGAMLANLLLGRMRPQAELVAALQAGSMRLATALTDTLVIDGHVATGHLSPVEGAAHATHVLVLLEDALAIVDLQRGGVQVEAARALGLDGHSGWCEVRLHNAPAVRATLDGPSVRGARSLLRLLLLARAHGAARRAFELAVDYAKERHPFGQAIGSFQAIQHKLADGWIALEGTRLTLQHAAAAWDSGLVPAPYFAAAASAFGSQALRRVALQVHHAFGAIGHADDHEAPRHFRRVHLDTLVLGGATRGRQELAAWLLDDDTATLPEYDLGEAGNAFRDEVRGWLQSHWTGDRKASFDRLPFHDREFDAAFTKDIAPTGWIGQAWPSAHGGQARSPREQLAFVEAMERAEAPRIGASVLANALILHGTPAQQARFLPEILRGAAMHGMGYSEPEVGSDLAALRTRAVLKGGEWIIDGQKIWTTTWWGKYMFLAAHTDPAARPPHAGISMFIVPMDTPGITIRSAPTMYDGSFANVFYDDVRIPADNLVGPLDGGWKVLTDALANERGTVDGGIVLKLADAFDLLCRDIRAAPELRRDPLVRERVGALAAEIEVGRLLMLRCAELAESGTTPPEMGAVSKVFSSELMERFGEAALELLGPRAALSQGAPGALRNGRYEQILRHSLMWFASIGTNEIQRNLIAQRGLGLPR